MRRALAGLGLAVLGALPPGGMAGTLDDFEGASRAPKGGGSPAPAPAPSGGGGRARVETNLGADVGANLAVLLAVGLVAGSELSVARMRGTPSAYGVNLVPRHVGDPDLPLLRIDANYQNVQGDTRAADVRVEAGWGPLGLQARHTHFREDEPRSTLDLDYLHGLVRVSASPLWGVDLGLGMARLDGTTRRDGFSATLPIAFRPHPRVEFRFAPAWSSIEDRWIRDHDLSAALTFPYAALRVGYRWLGVNGAMLKGPYAGVSLYF